VTTTLALVILVPFATAALTLLLRGRLLRLGAAAGTTATLLISFALAGMVLDGASPSLAIGGWPAPLGIELRVDGLSALLLLVTAGVASVTAVYAGSYFHDRPAAGAWSERDAFWPLWFFLWASLNALFVSGDVFNIYVALELVTLSGIALMVLGGGSVALAAGMRYLLAAFLGSLGYLMGVALLYAEFHVLDIATLGATIRPTPTALVAVSLMTLGLALKTALFPLHFWLPAAHASAPAPVSAALSALVVKGAFYVLLRLWFFIAPGAIGQEAAIGVGVLGAIAVIWGSLQAIRSERLKMMVAHSTVAQLGYLFLLVPLVTIAEGDPTAAGARAAADAWTGGLYHLLTHAFAKAAMFLAAGTVMLSLGHDRVAGMGGLATHLPIALFAFGLGGISLIGLPPMGGFVAKLLLLQSALATGLWWIAVVILAGGILTAGYVFLVVGRAFSTSADVAAAPSRPLPRVLQVAPLALALVGLVLGFAAALPLELMQIGSPFPGSPPGGG
jgi:multicomponent Na+:H+ antiporter subunit D